MNRNESHTMIVLYPKSCYISYSDISEEHFINKFLYYNLEKQLYSDIILKQLL